MEDRTRRELGRSFGLLVGPERSLLGGAVLAAVAYPVWVVGTGVAATAAADAAVGGVSIGSSSREATALAAVLALLWVVVPAAATVRLVDRGLTNVSGNLAEHYRVATPSLLLVAPVLAVLVAVAGAAGAAVEYGTVDGKAALALGLAGGFLLVRTVAFGYRVFALSRPRLLQALVFLSAAAAAFAAATRVDSFVDRIDVVPGAASRAGVADTIAGTASYGGLEVATVPIAASLVPTVLAALYLLAHAFAALAVRVREPDVLPSAVRPGQRYPDAVRPAGDGTESSTAAFDRDRSGRSGSAPDSGPADAQSAVPGDGSAAASASGPSGTTGADTGAGPGDESRDGGDDGETVGHTRVFTPPDDLEDPTPGDLDGATAPAGESDEVASDRDTVDPLAGPSTDRSGPVDDPSAGGGDDRATDPTGEPADPLDAGTDDPLGAGSDDRLDGDGEPARSREAASGSGTERCPICDARHAPDAVKCPNCNARLD